MSRQAETHPISEAAARAVTSSHMVWYASPRLPPLARRMTVPMYCRLTLRYACSCSKAWAPAHHRVSCTACPLNLASHHPVPTAHPKAHHWCGDGACCWRTCSTDAAGSLGQKAAAYACHATWVIASTKPGCMMKRRKSCLRRSGHRAWGWLATSGMAWLSCKEEPTKARPAGAGGNSSAHRSCRSTRAAAAWWAAACMAVNSLAPSNGGRPPAAWEVVWNQAHRRHSACLVITSGAASPVVVGVRPPAGPGKGNPPWLVARRASALL